MTRSRIKTGLKFIQQNYLKFIVLSVSFAVVWILAVYLTYQPVNNNLSYRNNNFNVFGLNIPRDLEFCGERIPVDDYALKDNLDKEFFNNKYWKSSYSFLLNKAQKWFPYIEPILKSEGVPDDFKYVAVIESHLSNAISPMGAAGFWQLVPSTARHYGLIVNDQVDERLDIEKSTRAACKLIKDAHFIFKNWTLTAAAYNLGIGGIQNELKKQRTANYYDLMLNKETGSFVYRILAYKTLFSSPGHFGIKQKKFTYSYKVPVKLVRIDSSITNLKHFAKSLNCNPAVLKLFNPWLLGDVLTNPERNTFEFKIPKKNADDYSAYFDDLIGKESNVGDSADVVNTPDTGSVKNVITHTVRDKETLKEIAQFYEVNETDIKEWNNIKDTLAIKTGRIIIIKPRAILKSGK